MNINEEAHDRVSPEEATNISVLRSYFFMNAALENKVQSNIVMSSIKGIIQLRDHLDQTYFANIHLNLFQCLLSFSIIQIPSAFQQRLSKSSKLCLGVFFPPRKPSLTTGMENNHHKNTADLWQAAYKS